MPFFVLVQSFEMQKESNASSTVTDTSVAQASQAAADVDGKVSKKIQKPLKTPVDLTLFITEAGEEVRTTSRICKGDVN